MIEVREERPEDRAAVREVNLRAFKQEGEPRLVEQLHDHGRVTLALVAVDDGRVVGHVLFSPVTIEDGEVVHHGIGLAPLAVLPEYQNRGIGSLLTRAGLKILRERGEPLVVVLGHANYYPRFGFEPTHRHGIRWELEAPPEAFMVVFLDEEAKRHIRGVVKFCPEFVGV